MRRNILIVLGILIFFFVVAYLSQHGKSQENVVFGIKKGEGITQIASHLEQSGLIGSTIPFYIYTFLTGSGKNLQAGEYALNPSMSIGDIVKEFTSGNVISTDVVLTIIPGWTLRDVAQYLESLEMFQAKELEEILGFPGVDYRAEKTMPRPYDFSSEFPFLADKPKTVSYEGYLYPDSYSIAKGSSLTAITRKILGNFAAKLTPGLRDEITRQGKSIFDIIRMASILEREVQTPEDKKIVAGILWKRLKAGMPLQVDATINYVLHKTNNELTGDDLKIKSPYNTYTNLGLPPTPISNPGIDSIRAAIYPSSTEFWYYLSTNSGKTIFSRNFEEHKAAKAKYLQ